MMLASLKRARVEVGNKNHSTQFPVEMREETFRYLKASLSAVITNDEFGYALPFSWTGDKDTTKCRLAQAKDL